MDISRITERVAKKTLLTPEEKKMVKDFEDAIKKYKKSADRQIKEEKDDKSFVNMLRSDVEKLEMALEDCQEGNFKAAFNSSDRWDTAVRDVIPTKLYNYMAKAAGAS